jgi:hypothetical protein
MLDINGGTIREGGLAQLLCHVVTIIPNEGVVVRVSNSTQDLMVGVRHDEAFGGYVADSELTAFEPLDGEHHIDQSDHDGVRLCPME